MIKDEKELAIALASLEGWRASFHQMKESLAPEAYAIYEQVHRPIVSELERQITQYELVKKKKIGVAYFRSPLDAGAWLIKCRIAQGVTQSAIAKAIGTSQAQISREEDAEYRNAPLMRLYEIARVLGHSFFELAFFKTQAELLEFNVAKVRKLIAEDMGARSERTEFVGKVFTTGPKSQRTQILSVSGSGTTQGALQLVEVGR